MNREEKDAEKKDILSWNTAINTAYANVSSIETCLAISQKIRQIQKNKKRILAAKYSFDGGSDPKPTEESWRDAAEKIMEKRQIQANEKMQTYKKFEISERTKIENELKQLNASIAESTASIEESKRILDKKIPSFDPNSIGDIELMRARINLLKEQINACDEMNANRESKQNFFVDDEQSQQYTYSSTMTSAASATEDREQDGESVSQQSGGFFSPLSRNQNDPLTKYTSMLNKTSPKLGSYFRKD